MNLYILLSRFVAKEIIFTKIYVQEGSNSKSQQRNADVLGCGTYCSSGGGVEADGLAFRSDTPYTAMTTVPSRALIFEKTSVTTPLGVNPSGSILVVVLSAEIQIIHSVGCRIAFDRFASSISHVEMLLRNENVLLYLHQSFNQQHCQSLRQIPVYMTVEELNSWVISNKSIDKVCMCR
jgi:hypothetical protein